MNKILVEVSVGELLDKLSILEIKQEKIKDLEKLKYIKDEYNILKNQLDKNVKSDDKLEELFKSLKQINSKLWVIEDEKRMCEKKSEFDEKFILFVFSEQYRRFCCRKVQKLKLSRRDVLVFVFVALNE